MQVTTLTDKDKPMLLSDALVAYGSIAQSVVVPTADELPIGFSRHKIRVFTDSDKHRRYAMAYVGAVPVPALVEYEATILLVHEEQLDGCEWT
jgi:hypothetical protein